MNRSRISAWASARCCRSRSSVDAQVPRGQIGGRQPRASREPGRHHGPTRTETTPSRQEPRCCSWCCRPGMRRNSEAWRLGVPAERRHSAPSTCGGLRDHAAGCAATIVLESACLNGMSRSSTGGRPRRRGRPSGVEGVQMRGRAVSTCGNARRRTARAVVRSVPPLLHRPTSVVSSLRPLPLRGGAEAVSGGRERLTARSEGTRARPAGSSPVSSGRSPDRTRRRRCPGRYRATCGWTAGTPPRGG